MKNFSQGNLSFLYPENWELIVDERESPTGVDDEFEVTLQTPRSAQWTVGSYPLSESPQELVEQVIESIQQEYDEVEVEFVNEEYNDVELEGADLRFFYLDLLINVEARVITREDDQLLIILQSENQELEETREVFRAILHSLLNP